MPKIVEVQGLGNVEFPDTMDDTAIGAALAKQAGAAQPMARKSPGQLLAGAFAKALPMPNMTPEENAAGFEHATGAAMGMTMPNPLPIAKQLLKGRVSLPQLPELPELVDAALPTKASKIYNILRRGQLKSAPTPAPEIPAPYQAPPAAPAAAAPAAPPPPPAAPAAAMPAAPAAVPAAAPPTAASIFEMAGRGRKVSELAKAIDANASAYLGVDPLDPRFADALSSLPQEWWEGMAQVAKINKPSPATVKDAVSFFRDRAAQTLKAAGQ